MSITAVSAISIPQLQGVDASSSLAKATTTGGLDFTAKMGEAIESVNDMQIQADDALSALASGEEVDLHGTMIALQEADIALRTMVSVRDKLISAYEQVMNMSI